MVCGKWIPRIRRLFYSIRVIWTLADKNCSIKAVSTYKMVYDIQIWDWSIRAIFICKVGIDILK